MSRKLLIPLILVVLALPTIPLAASAADVMITSGPARVALLELYTSEGCSSCPPADRWLSGLRDDARLWRDVVPVAFHVDYWDYIGWKDRFADSAYSERHRRYAREGGVRVVYTPGLLLNGKEWRLSGAAGLPAREPGTAGTLDVTIGADGTRIHYQPLPGAGRKLQAHVAWLGFDLESAVKAGENRGRQLEHDFVVLQLDDIELAGKDGALVGRIRTPGDFSGAGRTAVAAWVTGPGSQAPLQAVGGWLD